VTTKDFDKESFFISGRVGENPRQGSDGHGWPSIAGARMAQERWDPALSATLLVARVITKDFDKDYLRRVGENPR